jgi:septal ring factor EnvC (AmiA/AmiB activator)
MTLIAIAAAVCCAAALAVAQGAKKAVPPEAYDFVTQHEIMADYPDGKFHPERRVRRGELAEAIHQTVAAMAEDERLHGPEGPPGPQGPRGEAARDSDIARVIQRFTSEVDTDLTDIKDDIADLQDTTHELGGRTGAVEKSSAKAETDYEILEQRVQKLEAAIEAIRGDIARQDTDAPVD